MNARLIGRLLRVFVAASFLTMSVSACGPPPKQAKLAQVSAGTMPADTTWDGVYYSSLFGYLHVEQKGQALRGKWERPRKDRVGEMRGNIDGNLLRFDWTEYTVGLVGPNSKRKGKGYLVYSRPEGENVDDVVKGEAGLGENELGMPWNAIKQRNVKADLDSISGVGSSDLGGGDWDSKNSESGEAEAPAAPDAEAGEETESEEADDAAADAPELMK